MMDIKKLFLLLMVVLLFVSASFSAIRVRGSYRKRGSYVASHYRSTPDKTKLNNWSAKGNVNPYTGKKGAKKAYKNE